VSFSWSTAFFSRRAYAGESCPGDLFVALAVIVIFWLPFFSLFPVIIARLASVVPRAVAFESHGRLSVALRT